MPPKHFNLILACCWILIISIAGLMLYLTFCPGGNSEEQLGCAVVYPDSYLAIHDNDTAYAYGKEVLMVNCAACHHPLKDATGPALLDAIPQRSADWLCRFITDTSFHPDDQFAQLMQENYNGMQCMKFPQLTCNDIEALTSYLGLDIE